MEIKTTIQTVISIQEGATNINEILLAIGEWSRDTSKKMAEGVIEEYQKHVIKLLCEGKGKAEWVGHKDKGNPDQGCIGGKYKRGGARSNKRKLRTDIGDLDIKVYQIQCTTCYKRYGILGALLKIPSRQRVMIKVKHLMSETISDTSYRKSSKQMECLAHVEIPKSTLHRIISNEKWDEIAGNDNIKDTWEDFSAIMSDGTGYKRQKGETTKGNICKEIIRTYRNRITV